MPHEALFLMLGLSVVLLVVVSFSDYLTIRDLHRRLKKLEKKPTAQVQILSGLLSKATEKSGCWDIYAEESVLIPVGGQVTMPTGLVTKMYDCDAIFFSRSGLSAKQKVSHRAGFIDEDFPQEWKVILRNEGPTPYQVTAGDRVAQVYFMPKQDVEVIGGLIRETERAGGLGSTGV